MLYIAYSRIYYYKNLSSDTRPLTAAIEHRLGAQRAFNPASDTGTERSAYTKQQTFQKNLSPLGGLEPATYRLVGRR